MFLAQKYLFYPLLSCLKGPAQAVLSDLPITDRCNYVTLVAALTRRFGSRDQTKLFQTQLRSRRRKRDEDLPTLAQDIRRLIRMGYPDLPTATMESMATEAFLTAITDSHLRDKVRISNPQTLDAAVCSAVQWEAQKESDCQLYDGYNNSNNRSGDRRGFVRYGSMGSNGNNSGSTRSNNDQQQGRRRFSGYKSQGGASGNSTPQGDTNKGACYGCGEQSHLVKDCPKKKEGN